MQNDEQPIGYKGNPNLDLYGIGAFLHEVSEPEVLLYLFEKRLYLPALVVNVHYRLQRYAEIVSQKRDYLRTIAFLRIHIGNDTCYVIHFPEHCNLLTVLYQTFQSHIHTVMMSKCSSRAIARVASLSA